jgi:hypothetical protein
MSASVFVRGVGMWSGAAVVGCGRSALAERAQLLPPRMRGRASPLTLMLAAVAEEAAREAAADPARLPSVFGSAYGEMHTTATLLAQLWAAEGALSPAKFQASVHNTAAAQLSIALHNPSFSTSIAAGYDTVAMSLIEALAWLARHPGQVLVACGDEAPNEVLQPGLSYPPLAAAFVLDNVATQGLTRIALQATDGGTELQAADGGTELQAADGGRELDKGNPVGPALALAQAIRAGEHTRVSLDGYRVLLEPCAQHMQRGEA